MFVMTYILLFFKKKYGTCLIKIALDIGLKGHLFYYLTYFFLLFMSLIVLFDTIHKSHCIISFIF